MANGSPPAGWYLPGFDDSGWAHPVLLQGALPDTAFLWAENPPLAVDEINLFRYHFILPAGIISNLRVGIDGIFCDNCLAYMNGVEFASGIFTGGIAVYPSATLVHTGDNVLAILAQSGDQGQVTHGVFFDITVT